MYRKFTLIVSLVLVLGLLGTASAELVGQWKLDEGGGTNAVDASGNDNTGTLEDDPVVVDGQFGQALAFDNSRVAIPASDSLTADLFQGTFTLTAWINPSRTGNTWQQVFRAIREAGNSNDTLFINNDGRLSWRGLVGGGWAGGMCETSPDVVPADQWTHVAVTGDETNFRIYVNGELSQESAFQTTDGENATYYIGGDPTTGGESYAGMVDDLRVYNHVLSEGDIRASMENQGGAIVKAYGPSPRDGTLLEDTWISLSWRASDLAVSHDVYMGDNFDDVDSGAESTFQGNQGDTFYVAGFPGFAFPDGLVPGTTYYWRIDEVNEAEPNSPWKGDIWSFSIPPKTAYNPVPADGAKFIDPEADLSWTVGFGAKLHTVYFGDSFDEVDNAADGSPQGHATFDPGTLEPGKTYYWRVDEFDAATTYKGDVWSFTTAGEGGGVRANYYSGMNFESLVLDRVDEQIAFNWGSGEPDPAVGADNFSVRWRGEVEAAFTETYTFYTNSDDGIRLWIDGQQLISNWTDHGPTENRGTIDLVAGNTYSLLMEFYENGGGAVAELRWSSPSTPKDLIPQAALSLPIRASGANPANGAVDVSQTTMLTWAPGETAVSHDVYFGTDPEAVRNADASSPEYKGNNQLGTESHDPGKLEWNATYYWRVDEVEDGGTIQTGNVWSFTTADFLIVDDMESYNDLDPADPLSNRIFNAWLDGFGDPTNGSIVGYANPSFVELTNVNSGNQSMPFEYDNNTAGTSEATLTLTDVRNWTENGVDTLAIWYIGDPANAAEQMYVTLNGTARVNNPNANAAQEDDWTEWKVSLSEFTGVNLGNVDSITLGLSSVTGGTGMMFFDDIRLHVSAP